MRVGLFGGSFDPVHYGHLRAAQWALQAFDLREVRLLPARQSPFKGPCFAPEADRLMMLNLAVAGNPSLVVDACELDREAPSYTVDTLRALTQNFPLAHFTLILGSDAAQGIELWREISEVRRMAEIKILGRPGHPQIAGAERGRPFSGLSISSTEVRSIIRGGGSIRYLAPEAVRQYVEEKGLYK